VRRTLLALLALQLGLAGLYLAMEGWRRDEQPFLWEPLDEPAPPLPWERPDRAGTLPEGLVVVHFWATWCGPCRTELPSLLHAAEEEGVALLAVTDEPWPEVEAFFQGPVPDAVVRDPTGQADAAWQVSGLPDTLVAREGRVLAGSEGPGTGLRLLGGPSCGGRAGEGRGQVLPLRGHR
jgi:thiol-disulfide isomerase/thioredoxin